MRSKAVVLAATGTVLSLLCMAPAATPIPPSKPGAAMAAPAEGLEEVFRKDVVSGCAGSLLVRKVVVLTPSGPDRCQVRHVLPNLDCVAPGGVISWKVINNCRRLESSSSGPALEIKELVHFPADGEPVSADWLFRECEPEFDTLEEGSPSHGNRLHCDVPGDTQEGLYKYDLQGPNVDTLDPWVVVRRGGG